MTTSAEIEYSPDLARTVPLLPQAAALISDPLIRNRATLGGSLAAANPRGDWPPVVLAADATVHLRSRGGERAVSAREFFTRHGENRRGIHRDAAWRTADGRHRTRGRVPGPAAPMSSACTRPPGTP